MKKGDLVYSSRPYILDADEEDITKRGFIRCIDLTFDLGVTYVLLYRLRACKVEALNPTQAGNYMRWQFIRKESDEAE